MMKSFRLALAALAAAVTLGAGTVHAATQTNGGVVGIGYATPGQITLRPGNTAVFDYTTDPTAVPFRIEEFALQANGFNRADIESLQINVAKNGTLLFGSPLSFDMIRQGVTQVIGSRLFGPLIGNLADTFSVTVSEEGRTLTAPVALQLTFTAVSETTPVPVPAAGGLLLSAMLAGGFVARRRAKAATAA